MVKSTDHLTPSHFDIPSWQTIEDKAALLASDVKDYTRAGVNIITGGNPVVTATQLATLGTVQGIKKVTGQPVSSSDVAKIESGISTTAQTQLNKSVTSLFGKIGMYILLGLIVLFIINRFIR